MDLNISKMNICSKFVGGVLLYTLSGNELSLNHAVVEADSASTTAWFKENKERVLLEAYFLLKLMRC